MVLDRAHYQPPGRMVDVGSHRLHLYCIGKGSPTVVLEAAAPGWSIYWSLVQPEVAEVTRVCAYDRVGLGWSERGPLPRTGQRMADELHRLLERAGIAGPYILVGHSFGGFVARLYRQDHPNDVVSIVLVDAGHESQLRQAEFRAFVNAGKSLLPLFRAMTIVGMPRLSASFDHLPPLLAEHEHNVSEGVRSMLRAGWLRTSYPTTLTDESDALVDPLEQIRRVSSLGDLPLVVLTATGPVWWPDMPGAVNPVKFRKMWLDLQQDLTKLSSNSRQVFADQSSHFIPFDQPELVITAIRRLVETAHQKSTENR
ncbi:MAG: uncharacterized protein K0S58_2290 [Nitrospira sp.]|jgi:pimeloyl-ACP methyl ester carboxylesterase|nr:uncharacterized protein [Nitrospira sp.]